MPEKLLWALLLWAFSAVRSERQLMEQLDYNLPFRWFVGLWPLADLRSPMDTPVWDASTFSKNRDRLLAGDVAQAFLAAVVAQAFLAAVVAQAFLAAVVAQAFLAAVVAQPRVSALMSSEHCSVDGTLIQAWASHTSFRPKGADGTPPVPPKAGGRNAEADWRGQKRSNETHASTTDPDARLARKADGQSSILAYAGHGLMDNRAGLVRLACTTRASGTAERDASLALVDRLRGVVRGRITLGADKNDDAREHVEGLLEGLRARRDEPPRDRRRLFGLSHAASLCSSSVA